MNPNSGSLRRFLEESPFPDYLERCWNGRYYLNFPVESGKSTYDPGGVCAHVLYYLVYTGVLGISRVPRGRAAQLAEWLATQVREDGYCLTEDGFTDHPAYASTLGDALGAALFHAGKIGLAGEAKARVLAALTRLAERHPRIRFPEGAQGKTQQLRFELRIYYWMMLFSADPVWKERFELALERGIHRYTHPAAVDGPLLQPSLNPDWTWNYVCTGGLTDQHATNTHTPAYYCTEPNGFMFIYLHALRNKVFERRADLDRLCRNYIAGLLRNALRQNPDVICVGEIRDEETAEIAVHASQTGHLIIATLHSNDNLGTIDRLINLGVPLRSVAATLQLIVSQRLVRRLCHCKEHAELAPEYAEYFRQAGLSPRNVCRPVGCRDCDGTGYAGRVAIFDLMVMNNALRSALEAENATLSSIKEEIEREHGSSIMAYEGFKLVEAGVTSVEEVERVTLNLE